MTTERKTPWTPGPWECRDAPHAPFDGQFRVLGPYFPTHVKGQSFDDRHWICFVSNYHDARLIAAAPAMAELLTRAAPFILRTSPLLAEILALLARIGAPP